AGGAANVAGFRITDDGRLSSIDGATRALGLSETTPPQFLMAPAQIGLTPDGGQLLVTGKTNNFIDVFTVDRNGSLDAPVQTADASVPFAFTFSPRGQMDLVNAAGSLVAAKVQHDGTITFGTAVANGQTAACWIATIDGHAYVANTGSNDVSEYRIDSNGNITLVNAIEASGIPGAIDETVSGRFLYVQAGLAGEVDVFRVSDGGALTLVQTVTVPDGGAAEGIAAS
ncbi:MAG: beta-propeller fold lactonase family protein, partial [Candidatus Dormibacteraeota bacterium]|nr:beta-propeller fold lactonase family protein [Candidatus Dormibacteraeota bacterium]